MREEAGGGLGRNRGREEVELQPWRDLKSSSQKVGGLGGQLGRLLGVLKILNWRNPHLTYAHAYMCVCKYISQ